MDSDIFVSIFNDEILVSEGVGSVRIGLRAQTEGNVKPTEDFQITLDAVDGRASAGEDYRWPSPRFVFQAADFVLDNGHYVLTVSNTLEIINEEIVEKNENLELTILDPTTLPSYVTAPDGLFTGQTVEIRNDDDATVRLVDIVMNEGEEFEGRLVVDQLVEFLFTVIVSIQANEKYSSHDEFEKASFIVGLGQQSRTTFTVTSIDNSRFEPDQTFEVRLIGSSVPDSIKFDNDPPPTITVVDDEVPTRPTGPLIEVDDNGDGVVDADPVVTLPLGGTATFWVRPGACTGGKQVWLEGFSAYEQRDVPQHIALEGVAERAHVDLRGRRQAGRMALDHPERAGGFRPDAGRAVRCDGTAHGGGAEAGIQLVGRAVVQGPSAEGADDGAGDPGPGGLADGGGRRPGTTRA